jgi:pre-rRNA-processing protein IPI3
MKEVFLSLTSGDPQGLVVEVQNGQVLQSFKPCTVNRHGAAFLAPSIPSFFALQKEKGLIHGYGPGKDQPTSKFPVPERLQALAASPSGRLLAAGSESGKLYLWDISSGTLLCVVEAHFQAANVLTFSCDDMLLASGSADSSVKLFDTSWYHMGFNRR